MKNMVICMVLVVVAFWATNTWAAESQTVTVNATIAALTGGLKVEVSKITGTAWSSATSISFGTLVWDTVNHIFLPNCYYAVDIGVTDNTGTAWTLTHTRASLANGTSNLNNKVNVSFNKQTSDTASTELQKVSFANSNGIAYTKAQLSGGWLRIYYGVGTGEPGRDAAGVTPIGLDTPAGTYTGSVTITLTP